jgi:hypothetical protein
MAWNLKGGKRVARPVGLVRRGGGATWWGDLIEKKG